MSSTTRSPSSVVGPALVVAAGSVALFMALLQVALWSADGQRADERAMTTVTAGREAELTLLSILGRVPMWSLAVLAVVGLVLAVRRHDMRAAVGAGLVIAGANLTTQVTKHALLERSDFGLGVHNSLPSGHVTVVVSAVAALLIVVPPGARAFVAGLGTFATGLTGLSTIVAGWHRPGDVAAALIVTMAWCAVGVLVHGGRRGSARAVLPTALSGAVAALLGVVLIGVRPVAGMDGFVDASLVLGAVAAASALAIWAMARICPRS
ncbi:phosphatase PAP2 family protein [Aeromicrobium sp. 179-A 4D2 NHS]|uniref:phosphatase PAP2 family protein n=1 Tax=Aeromicrobium sp. 179-A 4D2 NHS TaxID=3142375 RepID=UPI0039A1969D